MEIKNPVCTACERLLPYLVNASCGGATDFNSPFQAHL